MHRIDLKQVSDTISYRPFLRGVATPNFAARHAARSRTRPVYGRQGTAGISLASATVEKPRTARKDPKNVHFWTADDMPSQVVRYQANLKGQKVVKSLRGSGCCNSFALIHAYHNLDSLLQLELVWIKCVSEVAIKVLIRELSTSI